MDDLCADRARRFSQVARARLVNRISPRRLALAAVNVGGGDAVDDQVGTQALDRALHCVSVGNVKLGVAEGARLPAGRFQPFGHIAAEQAATTGDQRHPLPGVGRIG